MTFRRTVLFCALGWLAFITGLHAWLNLGTLRGKASETRGLRIGYLPVT
jgi:hypothetical protein